MHSVSKNLQRDEEPGERDPKQRPLQGAFLIPPVLPVVLIESILNQSDPEDFTEDFWSDPEDLSAILDEESLLATCAYIDLNPVAAGVAEVPEASDHTGRLFREGKAVISAELGVSWSGWAAVRRTGRRGCGSRLAYVWGGRAPRAVAARSDSAIFPGFCSIPCSVFRDSVVTLIRDLS